MATNLAQTGLDHPRKGSREVSFLLVEDDDIDAQTFTRALQKQKILNPVYRARDGVEALDMLALDQIPEPYIIVLDLNMPRMNGLEFLKAIRGDTTLTTAIVFVLTTSHDEEDVVSAYREHVAGYISKQYMDSQFLQVVSFLDNYWRIMELP